MKIYRQGDVLIIPGTPKGARQAAPLENGAIILAHGEVTGHAHAIREPARRATKFEASGRTFLEVMEIVNLTHEEHAPVSIPPGLYQVLIQTEYTPQALRNVED